MRVLPQEYGIKRDKGTKSLRFSHGDYWDFMLLTEIILEILQFMEICKFTEDFHHCVLEDCFGPTSRVVFTDCIMVVISHNALDYLEGEAGSDPGDKASEAILAALPTSQMQNQAWGCHV